MSVTVTPIPAPAPADVPHPDSALARAQLTFLLQLAYSGELGAARAYAGHHAVLRDRAERSALAKILRDELHHRHVILRMLGELGSAPDPRRERKLDLVGRSISAFCHVGGWFLPMYGAGRLESQNIVEYEHAARLANVAGLTSWVDELLVLAEVEWDHELFFREKASSHVFWRVVPGWNVPLPRATIRERYAAWALGTRTVQRVRASWVIR